MNGLSDMQVLLGLVLLVAGPGGAAWIAVKVSLNGTRDDVKEIRQTVQRTESKVSVLSETTARLEERTDDHGRRIGRLEDAA